MPTLNQEYNALLVSWAEQGSASPPECEECGCDLTGKDVIETDIHWLCQNCADIYYEGMDLDNEHIPYGRAHDREDFHSDG